MVVPCKCCPLRHHTLETKKKNQQSTIKITAYHILCCRLMIGWPTVRHHLTISNLILRWIFRHLNATNIDITTEKRELCAICCGQTENIQHQRQIMCELTVFFPLFATSLIVFYRRELSPHILFELVFVFGTIWIHLKGISFVLTDGSMIFFSLRTTVYHIQFNVWRMKCADTCTSTAYCDDKQEWNHSTKYYIQIRFTGAHLSSSLWHFSSKWQIY